MKRIIAAAVLAIVVVNGAHAQQKKATSEKSSGFMAANGISNIYSMGKGYVVQSAEQFPEDKYSYQPTKDVRTFGQIVGHVADANNYLCGLLTQTPKPYGVVAEKLEGKAAIVAALKESFAACDAAVGMLTDADLTRMVNMFGQDVPLSSALTLLAAHGWEHYGNLTTYMRSNGMVPPSSQRN